MGIIKEDPEIVRIPQGRKPEPFASNEQMEKMLGDMDEEKEPFDRPVMDPEDDLLLETEQCGYTDIDPNQKRRSNDTANFIVKMADKGLAVLFAGYAHAPNSEDFEADSGDLNDMAEYWGVYLQDVGASMPPYVMAIIVTIMVVGKKLNMAKHVRTANIRAEKAEAEAIEAKEELKKQKGKGEKND